MKKRDSKTTGKNEGQEQAKETPGYSRRKALRQGLTVLSAYALTGLLPTDTRAELSTGANRLVLQEPDLSKQMNDLFAEIRRDKQREREFVDNPLGVLYARISPSRYQGISPQRIANANRMLYSIMSNDGFINWIRNYQRGLEGKRVNKGKVFRDFAEAMARFADPEFFQGWLEEEQAQWVSPGDVRSSGDFLVYESIVAVHKYGLIVWRGNELVNPADMRALTDLLTEKVAMRAKQLRSGGELRKEIIGIQ